MSISYKSQYHLLAQIKLQKASFVMIPDDLSWHRISEQMFPQITQSYCPLVRLAHFKLRGLFG